VPHEGREPEPTGGLEFGPFVPWLLVPLQQPPVRLESPAQLASGLLPEQLGQPGLPGQLAPLVLLGQLGLLAPLVLLVLIALLALHALLELLALLAPSGPASGSGGGELHNPPLGRSPVPHAPPRQVRRLALVGRRVPLKLAPMEVAQKAALPLVALDSRRSSARKPQQEKWGWLLA